MRGLTKMDKWKNEEVGRRVGMSENMSDRVNRKVLKWFVDVERMSG